MDIEITREVQCRYSSANRVRIVEILHRGVVVGQAGPNGIAWLVDGYSCHVGREGTGVLLTAQGPMVERCPPDLVRYWRRLPDQSTELVKPDAQETK